VVRSILPHLGERPTFLHGSDLSLANTLDAIASPSLFGGDPAVVIEGAEKMAKKDLEAIAASIPKFSSFLLLSAKSKLPIAAAMEKAGLVLDMTDEKSWDREKRLLEEISARALEAGKRLASDAAPLLIERLGPESSLLDREIDKLICYVGERPTIERSDVFRISLNSREKTPWQIAEEIVWEGASPSAPESFYSLIPHFRSQLQLGLKLNALSASGLPRPEWGSHLPRLWPKLIDKRTATALHLGASFFQNGLRLLFEIELLSRSGSTSELASMDLFRARLSHERR
jgi:DNA polymerase-3 subunit delta